jgi:putative ABC transport system substrate-binding protein
VGDEFTTLVAAFVGELQRLGYASGENLTVETRYSRPNSPDLAMHVAELIQLQVSLVVAASLPAALEVRKAKPDMAMVIATCPGMVSNGFAKSLERPGGNVTGIDELPPGVTAKRMKLLKEVVPSVSRVGLLSTTPGRGGHEAQLAEAEQTAQVLGVSVRPYRATSLAELESALAAIASDRIDGLMNFQGRLSLVNRKLIIEFAARHGIPAVYQATLFPESGGLMAWAPDLHDQFRIAARYVDQILRGARPGDLPIQFPPRYFLTVNTSAARQIGLSFPPAFLAQADRVIGQ